MTTWSLRRRLWAAFLVIGLLAASTIALVSLAVARLTGAQREVTRTVFSRYSASNDFFIGMLNQETGVRGFVATGRESFLEPYTLGVSQGAIARTRLLTLDRPSGVEQEQLLAVLRAADAWSSAVAEPEIAQVRRLGAGSVSESQLQTGRQSFNVVRSEVQRYQLRLLASRNLASDRLSRATSVIIGVVVMGGVGLVVVGVFLRRALSQWVTRPLESLGREVAVVSGGDLSYPVVVSGPPEVIAVGDSVETMRRRVVSAYTDALTAQAETEAARTELAEQAADLRRSNAELEQFAYVASHDLQEPLRKVASFTQMLKQRYHGQLDERADTYIDFAVDGAKRMQVLINDLLTFSRVGRATATFEVVDLDEALDAALHSLAARVEETSARVECAELPGVLGERSLLTQLFQNLLANAMTFTGPQPPRIEVTAQRDGTTWEIAVTDHGIGIEPQYAERIFIIFQRLHPRDEYPGTGIGLALCRKIVEFHGGRIWLDAASEDGATFRFTLPALQDVMHD